jgi:hypothetical protein
MKSFSIGIKLADSSQALAAQLQSPAAWRAYRERCLQMVTEGVKASVQKNAAWRWKTPTAGGLDSSWFTQYDGTNKAVVYNTKHYARYLNDGVRPHQMTYLLNSEVRTYLAWGKHPYQARASIPMNVSGNLIFRRPTVEAMAAGKWRHPGYPAQSFVEHGIEDYRTNLMPREIAGLIVQIMGGG